MLLGLNWVDLLIIIALIFFAAEGLGRSLVIELLDLISFLISFFLSIRFYNLASIIFEYQFLVPHGLALVLGFFSVWIVSELCFYLIVRLVLPKIAKIDYGRWSQLSFIPAFLRGLIFICLALVLIATFPIQPTLKKQVLDSKIGSLLLNYTYGLEEPVKNIFGGISEASLTFLTIRPQTSESVHLGFTTNKFDIDEKSENGMVNLINQERGKLGLDQLNPDTNLGIIARQHSEDMFLRGYFSHYSPEGKSVADRVTEAGIDFLVIGENLAYAPTLELAHKGLMNSRGHRANILSEDYGRVGIGILDGGVYGKMFTQVFSN